MAAFTWSPEVEAEFIRLYLAERGKYRRRLKEVTSLLAYIEDRPDVGITELVEESKVFFYDYDADGTLYTIGSMSNLSVIIFVRYDWTENRIVWLYPPGELPASNSFERRGA